MLQKCSWLVFSAQEERHAGESASGQLHLHSTDTAWARDGHLGIVEREEDVLWDCCAVLWRWQQVCHFKPHVLWTGVYREPHFVVLANNKWSCPAIAILLDLRVSASAFTQQVSLCAVIVAEYLEL